MRFVFAFALSLACGRIGFDPIGDPSAHDASGDGVPGDGVLGDTAEDGPSFVCVYMNCPGQMEACCDAAGTTCVPEFTCTGGTVVCDITTGAGCSLSQMCCPRWPAGTGYCSPALCVM